MLKKSQMLLSGIFQITASIGVSAEELRSGVEQPPHGLPELTDAIGGPFLRIRIIRLRFNRAAEHLTEHPLLQIPPDIISRRQGFVRLSDAAPLQRLSKQRRFITAQRGIVLRVFPG